MKHNFTLFAIMMMVSAISNSVQAYDFSKTNNGKTIYYRIISDSTVAVTYPGSPNSYHYWDYYQNHQWIMYTKPTGSIVIPSTVTNGNYQYTVTGIDEYTFLGCSDITSITLPSTIRTVGLYAFSVTSADEESLNSVYYSGTLLEWCRIDFENLYANPLYYGNHLFINNELVTNLIIPEGIDSIKNYSFIHMYNEQTPFNRTSYLDTIILPNTLRYIGRSAFEMDYYEKHLVIPSSVEYIEELAFYCALYGGVTLSSSIDTVRYGTFMGCMLPTLIIPDGVRYISNSAFSSCRSQYIEIPASVTAMGNHVFYMEYNTANAHHLKFCGRTPPSISLHTFDGVIRYKYTGEWPTYYDTMTIEVPCQSVGSYRGAANWDTVSVFICSTQVCLYEITAESNNDSLGNILGGGIYTTDDTCTLTAITKYNVSFTGWSDGVVDNPRIVSVSSDSVFVAMFSTRDTTILRDTLINIVHDTTYINIPVHDTTIVTDTVTLTEYVPVHDTTYIDIHDTTYINIPVHDTTIVTDTVTLTEYVPVHDTTYIDIHDTTYINIPVHDTTVVTDTITLTEYVPVHDTTYIDVHDTTYFMITDTVMLTLYDTVTITDTLWLTQYDTILIHDTIFIHDTIVVGVEDVGAINAKIYTHDGQIVVEGAEGNDVWLYDVNGRILATKQDYGMPIRFEAPASGTYMIKIGDLPARKMVVIR